MLEKQPLPDSEKPLHYGQIQQESYPENPKTINADEVERRGKDITDRLVGQALKKGGLRGGPLGGRHVVALFRMNNTVMAVDITDQNARDSFFSDMNEDESAGRLNQANDYRLFELSDEDFKACTARE